MNITLEFAEANRTVVNNEIWVTTHDPAHKLAGMQSISTPCYMNEICIARMQTDSICALCFSEAQLKYKKSLREHLENNYRILHDHLMTWDEAAAVRITTYLARIESFGDVDCVLAARNYIRIIATHPDIKFGVWTKNIRFWNEALDIEGKPVNMSLVYSSPKMNERAVLDILEGRYVDHIFTVWDEETYDATFPGTETECAGLSCLRCQKCYKRGGTYYIDERVRRRGGKRGKK